MSILYIYGYLFIAGLCFGWFGLCGMTVVSAVSGTCVGCIS